MLDSLPAVEPLSDELSASYVEGEFRSLTRAAAFRLPSRKSCELAAALVDHVPGFADPSIYKRSTGGVARRFGLALSPGVVQVKSTLRGSTGEDDGWSLDYDEGHRYERDSRQRITQQTLRAAGARTGRKAAVSTWSSKSRLNMSRTLAKLDWSAHIDDAPQGWRPQMLTLTLPREWLMVAPDGAAFKLLFHTWLKRWARRWGGEWAGSWKLEFQGRGAPHLHLYGNAPCGLHFERWLSASWTSVVFGTPVRADVGEDLGVLELAGPMPDGRHLGAHVFDHLLAGTGRDWKEGVRGTDPRSIVLYFLGKSVGHNLGLGKEYQHRVPEAWQAEGCGPGRFWGHRGLERIEVVRELDDVMFWNLRRLTRRYHAAAGRTRVFTRPNGRKVRRRARIAHASRFQGFTLLAPDAPAWFAQAIRWDRLGAGDSVPRGVDPDTGERRLVGPVGRLP